MTERSQAAVAEKPQSREKRVSKEVPSHLRTNIRDDKFNLFEVFNRQDVYGKGPFAEIDQETALAILDEAEKLAVNVVAPSLVDGDRNPPVYDPKTKSIHVPSQPSRDAYDAYVESGYGKLRLSPELGGFGAPPSFHWAVAEQFLGANSALYFYTLGPELGRVLYEEGNDKQKDAAKLLVKNNWGATMVLTEADAGSDFGAGRTKATEQENGTWHLDGVKRFITS